MIVPPVLAGARRFAGVMPRKRSARRAAAVSAQRCFSLVLHRLHGAATLLLAALALAMASDGRPVQASLPVSQVANADDRALVQLGRRLYATHCASCHGRYLQGQPLWQLRDRYFGRRAPALDQTGTAWRLSDAQLLAASNHPSLGAPPASREDFRDSAIVAVLAFVKARWPTGLRVLQALRNPGHAGMPARASGGTWTFPPDCNPEMQRAFEMTQARSGPPPHTRSVDAIGKAREDVRAR